MNAPQPTQPQPTTRLSWIAEHRQPAVILSIVPFLLLGLIEMMAPGTYLPPLLYFAAAGVWALVVCPFVLGLPHGRKPFPEFARDIRLLPVQPIGRNVLIGLMLAALSLGGILLASLLTKHFVFDWAGTVPPLRWVKGLTRGIWEEVFFRGILLAVLMRLYSTKKAIAWSVFIFAIVHINPAAFGGEVDGMTRVMNVVDIVSIGFMGLAFTYAVLKTGSLLPAIVFHYVHDIFVYLVQETPGATEPAKSALLFAFLWIGLALGAWLTKLIVERGKESAPVMM
ncbi:MAG: CPBP family intramembrane metalloprotease [Armatimonadetes bacterium]|nr:CPBP family intramembrane metalloprotease [Armatimonadota bacterium]